MTFLVAFLFALPMPRPLPLPDTPEGAFYDAMRERPDTPDPTDRLALADWKEEHGESLAAEIIRGIEEVRRRCPALHLARYDHLAALRCRELLETECAQIAARLRELLARDSATLTQTDLTAVEAALSSALGGTTHHFRMPPLLAEDGGINGGGLRRQYDDQRTLLASVGLPVGADRFAEVAGRLRTPGLLQEITRGRTILVLSPRVPLRQALAAHGRWLRRSTSLLAQSGSSLHEERPLYPHAHYQEEELTYEAELGEEGAEMGDGWLTEEAWLAEREMDALLVDPCNEVPDEARSISASQCRERRRGDEVFLVPQSYFQLFRTLLEATGNTTDQQSYSILPGCRFPSTRNVPGAYWYRTGDQAGAGLGMIHPDSHSTRSGVRSATRVL